MPPNGHGLSFWGEEHILELDGSGSCAILVTVVLKTTELSSCKW